MRFFKVTLGRENEDPRTVVVPSKTEIQANDAAAGIAKPGERILSIAETDSEYQEADALPPGTQAHPDRPF